MRVAARAYKGRTSLLRTVGNLQVTPVLMQDGRYLPEVTVSKKDCRARPSTYSPAVFTKDGRRGRDYRTVGNTNSDPVSTPYRSSATGLSINGNRSSASLFDSSFPPFEWLPYSIPSSSSIVRCAYYMSLFVSPLHITLIDVLISISPFSQQGLFFSIILLGHLLY